MTDDRRRHQHEVARLLETIGQDVEKLERLRAGGARGRGLAEQEAELDRSRRELASLVN